MEQSRSVLRGFNVRVFFTAGLVLMLVGLTLPATSQIVSPMQTGHYTPAAQGIRDLATPIPGFFPIWYNMYATSNTFVDVDGNEITNLKQVFPHAPDVNIAYDVEAFASIPMFFWASDEIPFLGNAHYMGGLSLNYVSMKASVRTQRKGLILDTTFTRSGEGTMSGFSDMFFLPLGLSWSMEKADVTLTYGFAAPTGRFDIDARDNIGLGFWTHQFQGFGYYYPVEGRSTAIMVGLTYEMNGEIKGASMTPGNRFSLEYGISQYLSERFELGAQGGHNWQITDDSGDDVYWDATRHDRKSTVAFYANYWPWLGKFAVALKYGFDYGARGRGLSNYWMLNFLYIPNILTGS